MAQKRRKTWIPGSTCGGPGMTETPGCAQKTPSFRTLRSGDPESSSFCRGLWMTEVADSAFAVVGPERNGGIPE